MAQAFRCPCHGSLRRTFACPLYPPFRSRCLRSQALDEVLDDSLQRTSLHQVYVLQLRDFNMLRYHVCMLVVKVRMCWVNVLARNQLEPNKFALTERQEGGNCGLTVTSASVPSSLPDKAPPLPCVTLLVGLGKPFPARARSSWSHTCEMRHSDRSRQSC